MIASYFNELVFYFALYSLGGWLLENVYSWYRKRVFWKEGFLTGPFKPMYGFAMLILVLFMESGSVGRGSLRGYVLLVLACLVVPTVVEYVSGVMLDKWFHRRYWDYSDNHWQVQGHVCLRFSVYWLGLSFLCLTFLHPYLATFYERLIPMWVDVLPWFFVYLVVDVCLTTWVRLKQSEPAFTDEP